MGQTRLHSLDTRYVPTYRIGEVAHYLGMPKATVRAWAVGQGTFRPVLRVERPDRVPLLSFANLVEVHVLDALRREHRIPLRQARKSLNFLHKLFPGTEHPLAEHDVLTDNFELFVQHLDQLVTTSGALAGQVGIRDVLAAHLERVDRDPSGHAARLYPFTRKKDRSSLSPADVSSLLHEPRLVVIDPEVQYGRPVLTGTGIPTGVIADRYKAGESIEDLARDYHRPETEIEEAIRCELEVSIAA